jgi:Cu/Ag efflux pump CusA
VSLFLLLGGEFLPKLEEGNIWARATMPLSVSLNRATTVAQEARRIFLSFPEVSMVLSQVGRSDDGTDATGFFNPEFLVSLKPLDQWPRISIRQNLHVGWTRTFATHCRASVSVVRNISRTTSTRRCLG